MRLLQHEFRFSSSFYNFSVYQNHIFLHSITRIKHRYMEEKTISFDFPRLWTDGVHLCLPQIVKECNEGVRKMSRTEELISIEKTLEFKSKVNSYCLAFPFVMNSTSSVFMMAHCRFLGVCAQGPLERNVLVSYLILILKMLFSSFYC